MSELSTALLAAAIAGSNGGGGTGGGDTPTVNTYNKTEIDSMLGNKVDKEAGKGLSTNDYTDEEKAKLASLENYDDTEVLVDISDLQNDLQETNIEVAKKVNAVAGMGLSHNDFTTALKDKLDSLENYDDSTLTAEVVAATDMAAINSSTLGYSAKNLLINNCKTTTKSGVTATVNEDGSITFTGANTGVAFILFWNIQTGSSTTNFAGNKKWLPNGKYIVSGGIDGVSIQMRWSANNTSGSDVSLATSSNGSEPIFDVTDANNYVWSRIHIAANADFSTPVTVYPMIRRADIGDNTYEPYRPNVDERFNEVFGLLDNTLTMTRGISIPSNSDLDDYNEVGVYYSASTNVSKTLANTPYKTGGFRLEVANIQAPQTFTQKMFPNSKALGCFFIRTFTDGAFGSWFKYQGEEITTTST